LLHAKGASLQKDIRQLLHIIRKNKENKTCTTLKQQTHISFKQKQSLFSFIKKKQQIISDHLATTSPLKKEKSSVVDHFLQEDFKLFVQSYEQLMRERAKKHNWTTDNEKELLSIIFSFTADVRFYLFYILDYAPKDLSIDQEKHKIEEPRLIMNHLYECPITHIQGEKNDLDIHHGLKQSWMYGSMKENKKYVISFKKDALVVKNEK
jgi:hypothetical protein